jgi:catechol 2,3-dioxygenase-like lactoylglutathione lyase family enzyme
MLDHVGIEVIDLARSKEFYEKALEPLGIGGAHVAFGARETDQVGAFHAAALAAGGADNGAPGSRPIYHSGYYGAFVLDPDGNNVEAVCHRAG